MTLKPARGMDGTAARPILYFEANGDGPYFHVCGNTVSLRRRILDWIEREIAFGRARPEHRDLIARLAEDVAP